MARLSKLGVDFEHWCFACGRLNPSGLHLDFDVATDRATARYTGIDHFVVPLPARMFVRGELSYTRFKTSFDGVGQITDEEGVYEAVDSTVQGSVKIGIQF